MSHPLGGLPRLPQAEEPLPALEPGDSLHRPAYTLSQDDVFGCLPLTCAHATRPPTTGGGLTGKDQCMHPGHGRGWESGREER